MKYRTVTKEAITPSQYYLFSKRRIIANTLTAVFMLFRMRRLGAERIADVGCGPALISILLARLSRGERFFDCYDVDPEMISIAQNRASLIRIPNIRFHLTSGEEELPVAPVFDFIISRYVIHHVGDKQAHLNRLMMMLKPGGELWIEDVRMGGAFQNAIINIRKLLAPMRGSLYCASLQGYLISRISSLDSKQVLGLAKSIRGAELLSSRFGLFSWRLIFRKKI